MFRDAAQPQIDWHRATERPIHRQQLKAKLNHFLRDLVDGARIQPKLTAVARMRAEAVG